MCISYVNTPVHLILVIHRIFLSGFLHLFSNPFNIQDLSIEQDQALRRKWINFVKVKRANWSGPTDFSALCSFHFSIDSFPFRHRFEMEQMGRKPKKVKLNEDAFPTIHALALAPTVTEQSEPMK
jgi:hypothetical protein